MNVKIRQYKEKKRRKDGEHKVFLEKNGEILKGRGEKKKRAKEGMGNA